MCEGGASVCSVCPKQLGCGVCVVVPLCVWEVSGVWELCGGNVNLNLGYRWQVG